MRLRVSGLAPSRPNHARLVRVLAFGLLGAGLSACATQQPPQYAGVYQPTAERSWKPDVEADGRPAQAPPVRQMRPEEDDPSQPWSPNYGKGGPSAPRAVAPLPIPSSRHAMPPLIDTSGHAAVAPSLPRTLSTAEADLVILRAIQAHEVRRP